MRACGLIIWCLTLTFGCTVSLATQKFFLQAPEGASCGNILQWFPCTNMSKRVLQHPWNLLNCCIPDTTIASLGPHVWKPQVILVSFFLRLATWFLRWLAVVAEYFVELFHKQCYKMFVPRWESDYHCWDGKECQPLLWLLDQYISEVSNWTTYPHLIGCSGQYKTVIGWKYYPAVWWLSV